MDASKWERVKQLFASALEREPAQRGAFLGEACQGDPSLLQEVESLLVAHQGAATTLRGTDSSADEAQDTSGAENAMVGRRFGPYQLLRRIGEGGMATVYLAVRPPTNSRSVSLSR